MGVFRAGSEELVSQLAPEQMPDAGLCFEMPSACLHSGEFRQPMSESPQKGTPRVWISAETTQPDKLDVLRGVRPPRKQSCPELRGNTPGLRDPPLGAAEQSSAKRSAGLVAAFDSGLELCTMQGSWLDVLRRHVLAS